MITRDQIIETVRSYVGTPHSVGGRVPGVGMDCAGIPICVLREHDIGDFDNRKMHTSKPAAWLYSSFLRKTCGEPVSRTEIRDGDILLIKLDGTKMLHLAIATPNGRMIHMQTEVRKVVETQRLGRVLAIFELPGLED